MATPKTIVSEIFYHKTSAMRFELGSYKDVTKFKIEIVPQLKDEAGNPVEKRFDYDKKFSMVFGFNEILRIKRFVENALNPQKQIPTDGYVIEHFFDAGTPPVKQKSMFIIKRAENKPREDAKGPVSPYGFKYTIFATLYSSMKKASISFGLTEEESYWIINMAPKFVWAFMEENARINNENRAAKTSGSPSPSDPPTRSQYRAPAGGTDEGIDQGEVVGKSDGPDAFGGVESFEDIPF
jgi:hypothetical protein